MSDRSYLRRDKAKIIPYGQLGQFNQQLYGQQGQFNQQPGGQFFPQPYPQPYPQPDQFYNQVAPRSPARRDVARVEPAARRVGPLRPQGGLYPQANNRVQRNQPRPGFDVVLRDMFSDERVVEIRAPGVIINEHGHLVGEEKTSLFDLVKQFEEVQRQDGVWNRAAETCNRFYERGFKDWNTSHRINEPPTLRLRILSDSAVVVGYLKRNHPPGRRGGEPNGRDARLAEAQAHLSISLKTTQDGIDWMWKDSESKLVSSENIAFARAMNIALDNFDQKEKTRICQYNGD
ncbi:hypothetical protein FSARC_5594 [Fusarium sarcochroum]|uniref:Uncharacterized protein n=1 Tax=Fusarium sarcochroum TaxID=1208366 RepID=A0A8H4TZ99_9HYPO|nr:hypothetical protein FSARC_5594 [Fusarium sarcochroum]